MTTEIVLMWGAVTLYAAGTILFVTALVLRLPRLVNIAAWVSIGGVAPHAIAIAVRWIREGHAPYLGFYEVVSSYAFIAVLVFALLVLRRKEIAIAGVGIMPIAFLMLGGAMLAPKSGIPMSATLASWWLTIHVTFAKLSTGFLIAGFGLAVVYLIRDRATAGRFARILEKFPPQELVDDLSFRLVGVGFILLGIMIVAGAIWANEAWGRYWNWDPIETWSLISWLGYALYLHLRLSMGWRGRRAAWVCVAVLFLAVFSWIGVPIAYNSIHGAYLTGIELKPGL